MALRVGTKMLKSTVGKKDYESVVSIFIKKKPHNRSYQNVFSRAIVDLDNQNLNSKDTGNKSSKQTTSK